MFASDHPFLDFVWTLVVFCFLLTFLCLLVLVVADIFRSGRWGWIGKTLWTLFVILIPIGGAYYYLLVRIFRDLRARSDLGGVSKAMWFLLCIVLSYFGFAIYLASQRTGMADRGTSLGKRSSSQGDPTTTAGVVDGATGRSIDAF